MVNCFLCIWFGGFFFKLNGILRLFDLLFGLKLIKCSMTSVDCDSKLRTWAYLMEFEVNQVFYDWCSGLLRSFWDLMDEKNTPPLWMHSILFPFCLLIALWCSQPFREFKLCEETRVGVFIWAISKQFNLCVKGLRVEDPASKNVAFYLDGYDVSL